MLGWRKCFPPLVQRVLRNLCGSLGVMTGQERFDGDHGSNPPSNDEQACVGNPHTGQNPYARARGLTLKTCPSLAKADVGLDPDAISCRQ